MPSKPKDKTRDQIIHLGNVVQEKPKLEELIVDQNPTMVPLGELTNEAVDYLKQFEALI